MTDTNNIEVLRAVRSVFDHIPQPCAERDALDAAITALSARASAGENLSLVVARMLTFENSEYVPNIMFDQLRVALKQFTAAPQPAQVGASGGGVAEIVRDLCELNPADPDAPETVCVRVADLERIVERHITPASPATGEGDSLAALLVALGHAGIQVSGGTHGDPWQIGKTHDNPQPAAPQPQEAPAQECKHKWRNSDRADPMLPCAWVQQCTKCGAYEDDN